MFASTIEDPTKNRRLKTEEEASNQHRQLPSQEAAELHPKTCKGQKTPEDTRSPQTTERKRQDDRHRRPQRGRRAQDTWRATPIPLYQPKEVAANRPLGEQDSRQARQRSRTPLREKTTIDSEREPPGTVGSSSKDPWGKEKKNGGPRGRELPAAEVLKSSQKWGALRSRASSCKADRRLWPADTQRDPNSARMWSRSLQTRKQARGEASGLK